MKNKLITGMIIYALVISFFTPEILSNDKQEVEFLDETLEKAIRGRIGKFSGPIYVSDLEDITELLVYKKDIESIEGLQYYKNLDLLCLTGNDISDISPLSDLTNLTKLSLDNNEISDISPLSDLTNLTKLSLDNNEISDISPLSDLTNLEELYLHGEISDISPLADLTNLKRLYLESKNLYDISPLSNLTNLEELYLSGDAVSDISSLANLTSLERLYLGDNSLSDLSPLSNLTNLTELRLSGDAIHDITSLADLTNLLKLDVDFCAISDISPLTGLTNLVELSLDNNEISDLSPLANLTSLERLYLGDNNISDLSPLANLTNLETLRLWGNNISDITPLADLTSLERVSLINNNVSDLSPLVENPSIGEGDVINVSRNPLSDESLEKYVSELEERGVEVKGMGPSRSLPSFTPVSIRSKKKPLNSNYTLYFGFLAMSLFILTLYSWQKKKKKMAFVSLVLVAAVFLVFIAFSIQKETPSFGRPKQVPLTADLPENVEFLGSQEIKERADQFSSDSSVLAVLKGNSISTFDRTTGEKLPEYNSEGTITHYAVSLDTTYTVISTENPNKLLLLNKEGVLWGYGWEESWHTTRLLLSPDGSFVIAGGRGDGFTTLYFIKDGEILNHYTYPDNDAVIGAMAVSSDKSSIVGTGYSCHWLTFFSNSGELLWGERWGPSMKHMFSNVTEVHLNDDGSFGAAVYDSTRGLCFFDKDGIFYEFHREPSPDIVDLRFENDHAVFLNADGTLVTIDKEGNTTETKIWEGKILVDEQMGVYGSEVTINGVKRRINDVKFSEDGEYIVIKADDTEFICMTREGEILWQHHLDQIVDFCPFNNSVIVYNGFSYSEILVITADGEESWRWNLGKDRYEIGRSPTIGPSNTYKYLYAEENQLYITTLKSNELYFFKIDLGALS
ncbi:MAG: leucine-rich repeat domain-containing protein [Euryarchaeota archaeon]|nr:leucine-rich repeat domain-containing protein [Euryarchaeota archaeon]